MSVAQQVLDLAQYPPVRIVETRLINPLPAVTRITYSEFHSIEPYLVWLRSASFDRNVSVAVIVEGTVANKRFEDIIQGASVPSLDDELPLNVPFDFDARVIEYNASAVPIANYQSRVFWEIQPYRVADKLSMGLTVELDDYEKSLVEKYQLMRSVRSGKLPMPYPKGDLQHEYVGTYAGNPAAGAANETDIINRSCPVGYKLVLTKLWANHPIANFGDLEIRVYRDKKLYQTLYPYCFPNYANPLRYERPVELWIPALSNMRVTVFSGTGHVGIIALAEVELRRLTVWDKIAWNLLGQKTITSAEELTMISELNLKEKLDAGVYEAVTPIPKL